MLKKKCFAPEEIINLTLYLPCCSSYIFKSKGVKQKFHRFYSCCIVIRFPLYHSRYPKVFLNLILSNKWRLKTVCRLRWDRHIFNAWRRVHMNATRYNIGAYLNIICSRLNELHPTDELRSVPFSNILHKITNPQCIYFL